MKTTFHKLRPKIICYKKYEHFPNDTFRNTILNELVQVRISNNDDGFNYFLKICRNTLDKLAPRKKKYTGGSNSPFMNKTLGKKIMEMSNLRNKYLKIRSEKDRLSYA